MIDWASAGGCSCHGKAVLGWLHSRLYVKVASCESQRHDVLVGCQPKSVTDALRGRWLGGAVESPHYQTSVVHRPLLSSMFIKCNAYCRNSRYYHRLMAMRRVEGNKREREKGSSTAGCGS